jgi:predicted dehydrogenase
MSSPSAHRRFSTSRRNFLARSGGALAGVSLGSALASRVYAGERNTIKIALVGCGGRGTGAAANALRTEGPTQLVAMADFFDQRLQTSLKNLSKQFSKQIDVPAGRQFVGLDAYKKAIDAVGPGGVVLLTTPPAFRPLHFEYAVERGCNVFMEKSFGVDAPGARRVIEVGKLAQEKNLKVAGGLMSRHYKPLEAAAEQIHNGIIGDLITLWAYREHGPVGFKPREPSINELAHQIRNYSCFTWLNGTFLLDWIIHNLDICCWLKGVWPVSAQGQGGRQTRTEPDQLFDHCAVEYRFADGTRLFAQGRGIAGCWGFFGDVIHGTKGMAVLGEGVPHPRIYKGYREEPENLVWQYEGIQKVAYASAYQNEHDLFFAAIRDNKPYNESERCALATMVGILGRMAVESGKEITWDEAMASTAELAPGLAKFTPETTPPVMPDAQGRYPVAMPGLTRPV